MKPNRHSGATLNGEQPASFVDPASNTPTLSVMMAVPFYPYPIIGGLERQAHELSKALLQRRLRVSVVSTRFDEKDPADDLVDGVLVHRLPYQRSSCLRFALLPIHLILLLYRLRNSYSVVHVHQYSWFGLFVIFAAKVMNKPVITKLPNVGERGIPGLRKGWLGWCKIGILKMSDAIVAMSRQSLVELEEIGFPLQRTLITPNGIALDAPDHSAVHHADNAPVKVVYVGRLTAQKGIEDLLQAWQIVMHASSNARLEIWGEGELRVELESLVVATGITSSVRFCGHVADVATRLHEMDIFVLPSYIEGNSNAVLEAMRAGLPVVATRVGGTEMQVGCQGGSFLIAPGAHEEMAARLVTLIQDRDLREGVGQAMQERVRRYFDIRRVAGTYQEAYVRLAEGKRDSMLELANPVVTGDDG